MIKKIQKKIFSKKIFFKKIFPKIFFQKVPFWGQRKYHFGASEKYHFGDSEISLALKFMLRIPFSMEIWGSGAAKKSTILGTAKVPFWGQRKVPFWGQRKYHFGDSEKLDLVTKNLFTKTWLHKICSPKTLKKKLWFWLHKIVSPLLVTKNFFTKYVYNEFVHCTAPSLGLKKKLFFGRNVLEEKYIMDRAPSVNVYCT